MYTYTAHVLDVIDGDTVRVEIDLGFSTWLRASVRLLGCNARELHDPGGHEAAEHLTSVLPSGTVVTLQTVKPDKYGGRYLAQVTTHDGRDLVQALIAEHWAASWDGVGTRPIPPWPRPEETPRD